MPVRLGMRRNPSGESVTPPRLGTSIAGDGRPERSLGDSTHELPAMPTVATATTPRSPFARSTASHSLVASNRVRLEDLVTEHELGDSSEVVARRVAGYLDLVASVALPLAYLLFILIYLLQYEAASMIRRSNFRNALSTTARRFHSTDEDHFKGTKFVHESPLGVETSKCCYRRGPAQG